MPNIAIVTDSTGDIPYALVEQHAIQVVPNILVIEGESRLDDQSFSREDFYQQLPGMKSLPTTGTASQGVYQELYQGLLAQGAEHILSIHASSSLSGIFNAASTAAQSFPGQVTVVDSRMISIGLGFQVLEAVSLVQAGKQVPEILAALDDLRARIHLIAMLDTLEYIRRSGRISWAKASLGAMLKIRLFVEIREGLVSQLEQVRTRGKGIARLEELLRALGQVEKLAILHSNCLPEAQEFLSRLPAEIASRAMMINVTTVIGTHTGPNALGFCAITKR